MEKSQTHSKNPFPNVPATYRNPAGELLVHLQTVPELINDGKTIEFDYEKATVIVYRVLSGQLEQVPIAVFQEKVNAQVYTRITR